MRNLLHTTKLIATVALLISLSGELLAQGRIVLNGATVTLTDGAYLVIDNGAANALTRASGSIVSTGRQNYIRWNISNQGGTYTLPWGHAGEYIPMSFTKSSGGGTGYFLFGTYHTSWDNGALLPPGVTDFNNAAGASKSTLAVDRFWCIDAEGYGTNPRLTAVTFSYASTEFDAPNTTAVEGALVPQRWNEAMNTWNDYAPSAVANPATHVVTLNAINAGDLFRHWTLDYVNDRHWVSAVASDWNNAANWSATAGGSGGASVPSVYDVAYLNNTVGSVQLRQDVTVAGLVANSSYTGAMVQGAYTINVSGGLRFAGGTFEGGSGNINIDGDLTLTGGAFRSTSGMLNMKGDMHVNGGSFEHRDGTVQFSGAVAQRISSPAAPVELHHIRVANTAAVGLSIEGMVNLAGVLSLNAGATVDADGAANDAVLTLLSKADKPVKDGAIDKLPAGAHVTGAVTVQRYMAIEGVNKGRIYRYISSPVSNATVSDLQNEIPVTGSFAGTSVCAGCGTTQSMFGYNEWETGDSNKSGSATADDGYVDFPDASASEVLAPGKGYALFVRGNALASARWDVRGIINAGNDAAVNLPVSYTNSGTAANDGWNLVGNPFPSPIDWNAASGWTKNNVANAIYIRSNGGAVQQYATWNGVIGTNGGSRYIATGQAFWVKTTNGGIPRLQANENVKAPTATPNFLRSASPTNLLRITLSQGATQDETAIHFRDDATEGFDDFADALKLLNAGFNLSSLLPDGTAVAINSMPAMACGHQVGLMIGNTAAGSYTLAFADAASFDEDVSITLLDRFTGASVDVAAQSSYTFSVTANAASFGAARFALVFAAAPVRNTFTVAADPVCESTDAVVRLQASQEDIAYTVAAGDDMVSSVVRGTGGDIALIVPAANLKNGENAFVVRAAREGCVDVATQALVITVMRRETISATATASFCGQGSVTLGATAQAGTTFNWYKQAQNGEPIDDAHAATFTTPVLDETTTYYVSALTKGGCESERVAVTATRFTAPTVSIRNRDQVLISSMDQGNQWYFNNTLLEGATQSTLPLNKEGVYTVVATANGCSAADEFVFHITGTEQSLQPVVSVYPNPVVSVATLEIPEGMQTPDEVPVFTPDGALAGVFRLGNTDGKRSGSLDMSGMAAGLYVARITGATGVYTIKILKK